MNTWANHSSILELLPTGISVFDQDQRIVFANPAYFTLLALPPDRIPVGTPVHDIFAFMEERGEFRGSSQIMADRIRLIASAAPHEFERPRPNGRWLKIQGVPVSDGLLRTYTDITEEVERRWRYEARILDLKSRLDAALEGRA